MVQDGRHAADGVVVPTACGRHRLRTVLSETACWGDGHQNCGSYDADGNFFKFITLLLAADDQCFTNVQYRAELYVGGRLAGALPLALRATSLPPTSHRRWLSR